MKKTIEIKYNDLLEVNKVEAFTSLERQNEFDKFKNITLAKSLIIGKHIAWYEDKGREMLANDNFKFDFSKTKDGIIKTAKAGEQTSMNAKNENCEFVHFSAHFYGIKKSDAYDARKVYKIDKKVIDAFLEQIQKDDNALAMRISALIKFAKQLDAGVSPEEQNSEASEKAESQKASRKADGLLRVGANQFTEFEDGKTEMKGDAEVMIEWAKAVISKLKMQQAREAKKKAKADLKRAEEQAKADMEMA
jgi:hypothetical protein